MRNAHRQFPLAIAAILATGCIDISGPIFQSCGGFLFSGGCVAFSVSPGGPQDILKGDTLRYSVYSDSGHRRAHWLAAGSIRLVVADTNATHLPAPDSMALVRGVTAGAATLRVSSSNSAHDTTVALRVRDSSEIARVTLNLLVAPTLRRGDSLVVFATLFDSLDVPVRGDAAWSVDAPVRAVIVTHRVSFFGSMSTMRFVKALDTGTVRVRAVFLTRRDSVAIQIVP